MILKICLVNQAAIAIVMSYRGNFQSRRKFSQQVDLVMIMKIWKTNQDRNQI